MAPVTAPERVRIEIAPALFPDGDRGARPGVPAPGQRKPRWSLARTGALCGVILLVSLLMVVAASAYLTQGQVRLTRMQGDLTAVLGQHHDLESQLAGLTNPSNVVAQSENHGLVAPSAVTDLTQVTAAPSTTTTPAPHHPSVGSTAP
jgi:hypothetical protein